MAISNSANAANAKKKRRYSRPKRTLDPGITFDYKDIFLLRRFINEYGRILPRRISGATSAQQRQLQQAIGRARVMALLACGPNDFRPQSGHYSGSAPSSPEGQT